ncbi:MAG: hypothetical protein PHI57_05980 [Bacteroidales bacterium]|jgi:hypothetical protein|nr:hypothetical protein [Bacteroidales bacterium]
MRKEESLFLVYPLLVSTTDQPTIRASKPLFYSCKSEAMTLIRNFKQHYGFLYDEKTQEEHVYCLVLEEFAFDSPYRYQLATCVFSPEGVLLSDCNVADDAPFLGRNKQAIYHQVGDLVEVPSGDELKFGIVLATPACLCESDMAYGLQASDDCYTVIEHPSMEVNYAHAPLVFAQKRPIKKEVQEALRSALHLHQHISVSVDV